MGYIEKHLISDESIAYRAWLHWIVFIKPGLISVVVLAIANTLLYFGDRDSLPDYTRLMERVGLALFAVAAIPLIVAAVRRSSMEFVITNKRVVMKTGILLSKTEEMFLNKVSSIGVDQSATGRVLGYGSVVIRGAGGSWEPLEPVAAPLEFRRQIQEQIGRTL